MQRSPGPILFLLLAAGCGSDALTTPDGGSDGSPGVDVAPAIDIAAPDTAGPDATGACTYNGATYPVGARFPAEDGCNTCTCEAGGGVYCTEIACPPRDGGADRPASCDFSTSYSYGPIGGNALFIHRTQLAPGNKYTHTRSPLRSSGMPLSCSPALPPCGAQDVITAYDIEVHDLPHPDVQAALAAPQPLLYGNDPRPYDGTVLEFKRADGRGFLVGDSCDNRPTPCRPIPGGLAQLAKRLQDLDAQQLAKPECAQLR